MISPANCDPPNTVRPPAGPARPTHAGRDAAADPSVPADADADAVLAAKGRSFHWARRLLGPTHAARATILYGFCRRIDDAADEAASASSANAMLAALAQAVATGRSTDPGIAGALRLLRRCRIDPAIPLELIEGAASDTGCVRVPDEAALLRYCYKVAGTVGLMMCGALDVDDPAALPHAADLGIAMQLTNICRDVADDAAAGRRYLPASMIGDVPPAELIDPAGALQPRLRRCVASLLDLADVYYASGERGLPYLPVGARAGVLVAARVYRAIGVRLRRQDHAYWAGRAVVRRGAKAAVTAQALLTVPLSPSFWWPPRRHDGALHAALAGPAAEPGASHAC